MVKKRMPLYEIITKCPALFRKKSRTVGQPKNSMN